MIKSIAYTKRILYRRAVWGLGVFLFVMMAFSPMAVLGQNNLDEGGNPFDGFWSKTKRQHTDCSYAAESDITFSTDAGGVTRAVSDVLGVTRGKVEGRTYTFEYGIKNGVPSGRAVFTLGEECASFTGTFSDVEGHKGNWSGRRGGSPFEGFWPSVVSTLKCRIIFSICSM